MNSHVWCQVSHVKCCMSHITFPMSPALTTTTTDPPLAKYPLCTEGWITKTEPKNPKRVPQGPYWHKIRLIFNLLWSLIVFKNEGLVLKHPNQLGFYLNQPPKSTSKWDLDVRKNLKKIVMIPLLGKHKLAIEYESQNFFKIIPKRPWKRYRIY